ncbi:hypothetical protein GCM10011617_11700 [Novosphingobium arvoryzae]|uniref:Uncharacterized protein n=2 Tax=Novosphingobium arvoryzae TaxID=1256514 RepID=A0A918RE35_9SPHN|nr:hypothetical protein GCM10011617_11700 [Novosphingobium arvoryzae]
MSSLSKFTFKTLAKAPPVDPIQRRRDKIIAAIEQQKLVLAAAIKGETFTVPAKAEGKPAKAVRAWWVGQDNGYYVQCRYGARPLLLNAANNAVFVNKLDEVSAVLTAFAAAAKAGELDAAMAAVAERKKG